VLSFRTVSISWGLKEEMGNMYPRPHASVLAVGSELLYNGLD
jgi:hypothetical protein